MMKKIFFIIVLFFVSYLPVKAISLPVEVSADAVVLMNADTKQIVYEKNPDKKEIMASLTKLMTVYTVFDNIENIDTKITISDADIYNLWGYTVVGLEVGDRVTYRDLIYGALLKSGADAALALANHTSGTEEEFVKLMNEEAQKLGMRNTHFTDSYGGDDGNISTAREMALFLNVALENKDFKKAFGTNRYQMSNGLEAINYTEAIEVFHGLDTELLTGNKSGFTLPAGLLLASTATINGINYILIVCKSDVNSYYSTAILETHKIYDYVSNQKFIEKTIIPKGTILKTIEVVGGTTSEYVVSAEEDIIATIVESDTSNITYDYNITDSINAKNKIGDNLGYIDILVDGEVIYTYNVYLHDNIFTQNESHLVILVIIILAFIIIVLFSVNIFNKTKKTKK